MIDTEIEKGKVFPVYYVSCGKCEKQEPIGVRIKALVPMHLERGGWKYTKQHGYVCSECRELSTQSRWPEDNAL